MKEIRLETSSGCTGIQVGPGLSGQLAGLATPPVLLVDENVLREHRDLFSAYPCLTIPSGESHKNLQTVEQVYRELMELEADRSSLLVGIGGGLATDVAGFVASTFLRGTDFGFISSTLLGQVDAAIGGKNGVNLDAYKNMIGTFRQPAFVWCDLSLLQTLSKRQYVSGIAEVIKYGAIADVSFLDFLEQHMPALLRQDLGVLEEVVGRSAFIKVDVVRQDEHESDLRRILNFGHTLGHAIERHQKLLHGEAIALGMILAARLSYARGLLPAEQVDRLQQVLIMAGLPAEMDLDARELFENIRKDKKRQGKALHFILLKAMGEAVVEEISMDELRQIVYDLC